MAIRLNDKALSHARGLLRRNKVAPDERDDWSEHAPSTSDENTFINEHGMDEYALWHLGEDTEKTEGTKGRYSFPYGGFADVHRCAVISGESRAGQNDHARIEKAFQELLASIDNK